MKPAAISAVWLRRNAHALAIALIATGIQLLIAPILKDHSPYGIYYLAIIIAARVCGVGASVVCMIECSIFARYWFVPPRGSSAIAGVSEMTQAVLFFLVGSCVIALFASLQKAHRDVQVKADLLVRAEAELRRERGMLRSILDSLVEGVSVVDRDGSPVFRNRAADGFSNGDAIPHSASDCRERIASFRLDGTTPIPVEELPMTRALRGETVAEAEMMVQIPGAEEPRALIVTACPLTGDSGAPQGAVAVYRDLSERLRAERRLKESEGRLRNILDHSPTIVFIKDLQRRYQFVNRRCASLWHLEPEKWIGKTADEILSRSTAELFRKADLRLIETLQPSTVEEAIMTPEGEELVFLSVQFPLKDAEGRPSAICGISLDITGRKRAETALRESEERFHSFMEHGPVHAWMKDRQGRYTYVNRAVRERLGLTGDKIVGMTDYDLAPSRAEEYARNDIHVRESGVPREVTEHFDMVDGERRTMLNVKFPLSDSRGDRFVGGIGIDITEQLRAARRVAEGEARFRGLFEHSPIGMAIATPDGRLLETNRPYREAVGRTEDEIRTSTIRDLTHPDDLEMTVASLEALLTGERSHVFLEKRYLRPDGRVVWANTSAALVRDESGEPLYYVAQLHDITQSRADRELIRASLEEKEGLLREVHHRVKNNLQVIASLLYLQSTRLTEPTVVRMLLDTRERVLSMAMVHDLIYRSGNFASVRLDSYVRELVSHLVQTYKTPAQAIGLGIEILPMEVSLDEAIRLGLIINELVSNAMKHAFRDGRPGRLTVGTREVDHRIVFEVSDDGVGLPGEFSIESRKMCGLAMVAGIAQHLGGFLDFDRARGTTFRFVVPLKRPDGRQH